MSWRTVVINYRCKLETKLGYLICRAQEEKRIHLSEIAVLIIESTAVSMTTMLIAELIDRKIKIITCDEKHNPNAEIVPCYGKHNDSKCIRKQLTWQESTKGEVWRYIIKAKIYNQALLLKQLNKADWSKIASYISDVQLGDTTNREGHAAKVYFNNLFGEDDYNRNDKCAVNSAMNYGYSILLSLFNREVAANGYLTQLGIWHDNEFNHFNFSCDLMEPFRYIVDRYVVENIPMRFDTKYKHQMLQFVNSEVFIKGKKYILNNAISVYTRGVLNALNDNNLNELVFADYEL